MRVPPDIASDKLARLSECTWNRFEALTTPLNDSAHLSSPRALTSPLSITISYSPRSLVLVSTRSITDSHSPFTLLPSRTPGPHLRSLPSLNRFPPCCQESTTSSKLLSTLIDVNQHISLRLFTVIEANKRGIISMQHQLLRGLEVSMLAGSV